MKLLAYSIYYSPEVASTSQLVTEIMESLATVADVTVICAVPCYTGVIPEQYSENKVYFEDRSGVEVVRVPVPPFSKDDKRSRMANIVAFWRRARRATKALRGEGRSYDVVFTLSSPPLLGGMLGRFGAKVFDAEFVYGIQDVHPEITFATGYAKGGALERLMLSVDARSCRAADLAILPGRDMVEHLDERLGGRRVPRSLYIPNWTDEDAVIPLPKDDPGVAAFRERWGLSGKTVVMYSGNIGLYYDLESVLGAAERLRGRKDLSFAFVGDGALKGSLEAKARDLGLENVAFIPYQAKEDLRFSLNAADAHIVCNARGMKGLCAPSKLYGVMATNVPVVGILEEGSEAWRTIEDSGCGVLVDVGDVAGMARAFSEIADDPRGFAERHATGRSFLEGHFSKRDAVSSYVEAFTEVSEVPHAR